MTLPNIDLVLLNFESAYYIQCTRRISNIDWVLESSLVKTTRVTFDELVILIHAAQYARPAEFGVIKWKGWTRDLHKSLGKKRIDDAIAGLINKGIIKEVTHDQTYPYRVILDPAAFEEYLNRSADQVDHGSVTTTQRA